MNRIEQKTPSLKEERKALRDMFKQETSSLQEEFAGLKKENIVFLRHRFDVDKLKIIPIGDVHLGHNACDMDKFRKTIQYAKEKDAKIVLMGDLIEFANKTSVGDGVYRQILTPMEQYKQLCAMLAPVKENILGSLMGNHENRLFNAMGFNLAWMIADKLDVPYLGWGNYILLDVKKQHYSIYATHGSSGARFLHTKMKAMKDLGAGYDADIILMGHTHDLITNSEDVWTPTHNGRGIEKHRRVYVNTGHFLGKYDPEAYWVMKGLAPSKTGVAKIVLDGNQKDIHVSL